MTNKQPTLFWRMKNITKILIGSVTLFFTGCAVKKTEPLLCYSGGTMLPVMKELASLYTKKTGQIIEVDGSGDSGELLIKIQTTRKGDLYVCHDPFLHLLMKKGLGEESWTVARLQPMIAVQKGNPKNIRTLKDLTRTGIRLGLTDEKYSTGGWVVKFMFEKAGIQKDVEKNIVTRIRTGGAVANAVGIGSLDATIVWNAVIYLRRDKLDGIEISPEFLPKPNVDVVTTATIDRMDLGNIRVTIATLKCSKQLESAKKFAEFVASPSGQEILLKYGFTPPLEKTTQTKKKT